MADPSVVIVEQFQAAPYNFDVPPPGSVIGPLKALFTGAGQAVADLTASIITMEAMATVQQASGVYLDLHGVMYGVLRLSAEIGNDDAFRARVLAVLASGKLTLAAIQSAVEGYFASTLPVGTPTPTVSVFDLRSNPAQSAADGLVILDFEISISFEYGVDTMWFLDPDDGLVPLGGFLGDSTYLDVSGPYFVASVSPDMDALIARVKAAGTHPVYKISATYIPGPTP